MEISTAVSLGLGIAYYVFHDGELSQIAQAQEIPYNRKPCTTLGTINFEGTALATGADYIRIEDDDGLAAGISAARKATADGKPVIIDIAIDYSKRTAFTLGTVKTNFRRFPLSQKVRMLTRAIKRKIIG